MSDRLTLELQREARELATVERAAAARRATPDVPVVRFLRADELVAAAKPISWAIRRHLERSTTACLYGDPEAGKSFLALDWALHIASGNPWHGHAVAQGAAFHLAGEGADGVRRRVQAWAIRHGVSLDGLPFYAHPLAINLSDPTAAMAVGDAVKAMCDSIGAAPILISVDTLSRHLGGDENSTADMARFIHHCDTLIREPTGATINYVHHMGHGSKDRARGSTVLRGAVDTEYRMARDVESGIATVTCSKAKDWPHPDPMHFLIRPVELGLLDDDGMPVTSAVLDPCDAPAAPRPEGMGTNQRAALAVLRGLVTEHRQRLKDDGRDSDTARVSLDDWRTAVGLDRRRWPEVRDGLLSQGAIHIEHPYVRPL